MPPSIGVARPTNASRNRGVGSASTAKPSSTSTRSEATRKSLTRQNVSSKTGTKPFSTRSAPSNGNTKTATRKPRLSFHDKENSVSESQASSKPGDVASKPLNAPQSTKTKKTTSVKKVSFTQATQNPTGNGINSLRRTLRDSVTPPSKKSQRPQTPASDSTAESNPHESFYETPLKQQRTPNGQLPNTPKTILQEQLELTLDESFLVSPGTQTSGLKLHDYISPPEPREELETISNQEKVTKPPLQSPKTNACVSLKRSVFSATKMNPRSILRESQTPARKVGPKLPRGPMIPYETPCDVQNPAPTLLSKPVFETPASKRKNGVCLDLTALFVNEQQTVRKCNRKDPNSTLSAVKEKVNDVPTEDSWAEMQCETFSKWLNFVLDPTDDTPSANTASNGGQSSDTEQAVEASNENALRTLMLHQYMTRVRSAASNLFQSYEMKTICKAIDAELDKGKLAIRGDRDMHSDLTQRKKITSLLMSYSTPWLRLGLETLFGETILPEVPSHHTPVKVDKGRSSKIASKSVRVEVQKFIVNRLITDSKVLAKYTKGRCKVPSGKFETRYRAEMRTLVLRRILVLIFFLDRAKQANLLDSKASRLFMKSAAVKSSRDVLLAFCRDFLASQGDITKHLSRVSLKVFYKQEPIEEIDMKINNFAVDLRDGVRLTKIADILIGQQAGKKSLLNSLRIPAVSRLQKLHNVGIALTAFREAGVGITDDVAPYHIVDGHRSMVLKMMWAVISHYSFPAALDAAQVESEIESLQGEAERRGLALGSCPIMDEECNNYISTLSETEAEGMKLLFQWCQSLCGLFGLPISDFSESFADGKALCFMVHYYHPRMLSVKEIRATTRDLEGNKKLSLERARYNEICNSSLAHTRMSELGGIPSMMPTTDSTRVPDAKSMMVYLSYAFSRLLTSRREIQAILRIQNLCRGFLRRRRWLKQSRAAKAILKTWRECKDNYYQNQRSRYYDSVVVIEEFVWSRMRRLKLLQTRREERNRLHAVTTKIQSQIRLYLAKKSVQVLRSQQKVAIFLQQCFRMRQAFRKVHRLHRMRRASIECQRCWRGYSSRKQSLLKLSCVLLLQAIGRGWIARRRCSTTERAATRIQSVWRGFWAELQYQIDLMDIITIQSVVRKKLAARKRALNLEAATTIQAAARQYLSRCILLDKRRENESATTCQRYVRRYLAARKAAKLRLQFVAATIIQREWRAVAARCLVYRQLVSAVLIQSFARSKKCTMDYKRMRLSAITIQAHWKIRSGDRKLRSVILLQKCVRSWIVRRAIERQHACASKIQSIARSHFAQKHMGQMRKAAVLMQAIFRGNQRRMIYQSVRSGALTCQKRWRGFHARQQVSSMYKSAVIIQAVYRRSAAVRRVKKSHYMVTKIQAWWRSTKAAAEYQVAITGIVRFQELFRATLSRRNNRQKIALQNVMRRAQGLSTTTSRSAAILQSYWRAKYQYKRYENTRFLAIQLSALARGMQTRQKQTRIFHSSVKIQSVYRRFAARTHRQMALTAVTVLQNSWRRYQETHSYMCKKHAAAQIQYAVRTWLCQRKARQTILLQAARSCLLQRSLTLSASVRNAAVCIQKRWRSCSSRQYYSDLRASVVRLQAFARRAAVQKRYQRLYRGVKAFQRQARVFMSTQQSQKRRQAVGLIQACCRGMIGRRKFQEMRHKQVIAQEAAAVALQKLYRGRRSRRQNLVLHSAATEIQRIWRGFLCMVDFHLNLCDVLVVQSLARRWLAIRKIDRQMDAIILIQSVARMVRVKRVVQAFLKKKNELRRRTKSSLCIQRLYRGYLARRFAEKQRAARSIQKVWRAYSQHVEFLIVLLAAITIQSQARMLRAKRNLSQHRNAATCIQKTWRGFYASFQYDIKLFSGLVIQRNCRTFLAKRTAKELRRQAQIARLRAMMPRAATTIQVAVRYFLAKRAFVRLNRRIAAFQGVIRGFQLRKRTWRTRRVRITAARLKEANLKATKTPNMQLGARTLAALTVLQTSKSLAEIMAALCTLEMSTRFSQACCESFAHARATDILVILIRQCNRSRPHVNLLEKIVLTLTNVSKYNYLLTYVATVPFVEVLLDLVQQFRDKIEIFDHAAPLLERCIKFDTEAKVHCMSHENQRRLKGVYSLCKRKLTSNGRSTSSVNRSGHGSQNPGLVALGRILKELERGVGH